MNYLDLINTEKVDQGLITWSQELSVDGYKNYELSKNSEQWDGKESDKPLVIVNYKRLRNWGEELMFASVLGDLANDIDPKNTYWIGNRHIHNLFVSSFGINYLSEVADLEPLIKEPHYWIDTARLAAFYRKQKSDFSSSIGYIKAPDGPLNSEPLGKGRDRPLIGISWCSFNPGGNEINVHKSIEIEKYINDLKDLNASFVSVQFYLPGTESEKIVRKSLDFLKERLGDRLIIYGNESFSGEMSNASNIISGLDMVISNSTSIAHLAGSMGISSVVFCKKMNKGWKHWEMVDENGRSLWYPNTKILMSNNCDESFLRTIKHLQTTPNIIM